MNAQKRNKKIKKIIDTIKRQDSNEQRDFKKSVQFLILDEPVKSPKYVTTSKSQTKKIDLKLPKLDFSSGKYQTQNLTNLKQNRDLLIHIDRNNSCLIQDNQMSKESIIKSESDIKVFSRNSSNEKLKNMMRNKINFSQVLKNKQIQQKNSDFNIPTQQSSNLDSRHQSVGSLSIHQQSQQLNQYIKEHKPNMHFNFDQLTKKVMDKQLRRYHKSILSEDQLKNKNPLKVLSSGSLSPYPTHLKTDTSMISNSSRDLPKNQSGLIPYSLIYPQDDLSIKKWKEQKNMEDEMINVMKQKVQDLLSYYKKRYKKFNPSNYQLPNH